MIALAALMALPAFTANGAEAEYIHPPGGGGGGGGGGSSCPLPTWTSTPSVSVQNGYQNVAITWGADTSPYEGYTTFNQFQWWNLASGGDLPVPNVVVNSLYSTSSTYTVNLNELTAGSSYGFSVTVYSGCGAGSQYSGAFSTASPPSAVVGWVYQLTYGNYNQLNGYGAPISGATVDLLTNCEWPGANGWYSSEVAFGTTTNSNGYFQLNYPMQTSYSDAYGDTFSFTLYANGDCHSVVSWGDGSGASTDNTITYRQLMADEGYSSYWTATANLGATSTAQSDYKSLALEPDASTANQGMGFADEAAAFVHTSLAECSVAVASGGSLATTWSAGGNGYTSTSSFGAYTSVVGTWGESVNIANEYTTTGDIDETGSTLSIDGVSTLNSNAGTASNVPGFSDPITSPSPGWNPPSGSQWSVESVYYNGGSTVGLTSQWYNGGSNTATGGLQMSVGFSAGWNGVSGGVSIPVDYTTIETTSSSYALGCSFHAPPQGYEYRYFVYLDGGLTAAQNQQTVNVHVFFDEELTA